MPRAWRALLALNILGTRLRAIWCLPTRLLPLFNYFQIFETTKRVSIVAFNGEMKKIIGRRERFGVSVLHSKRTEFHDDDMPRKVQNANLPEVVSYGKLTAAEWTREGLVNMPRRVFEQAPMPRFQRCVKHTEAVFLFVLQFFSEFLSHNIMSARVSCRLRGSVDKRHPKFLQGTLQ